MLSVIRMNGRLQRFCFNCYQPQCRTSYGWAYRLQRSSSRYLSSFIFKAMERDSWVESKIDDWALSTTIMVVSTTHNTKHWILLWSTRENERVMWIHLIQYDIVLGPHSFSWLLGRTNSWLWEGILSELVSNISRIDFGRNMFSQTFLHCHNGIRLLACRLRSLGVVDHWHVISINIRRTINYTHHGRWSL